MTSGGAPHDRPATLPAIIADDDAFREWYDLVLPRVYGLFLSRAAGNDALAEELTRQAFVEAVRRPDQYDGRTDIVTWLYNLGLSTSPMPLPAMGFDRPMDRPAAGVAADPHPAFAETLLTRLRAEAGRTEGRGRRWILVAVAGVLLIAALIGGVILGGGLMPSPPVGSVSSPTATPSRSAQATPSASPTVSPAGTVAPSPSPGVEGAFALGTVIQAIVPEVTLRETPGTGGARIGTLPVNAFNYVVDGPQEADGYQWYRLSGPGIPPNSGCTTPIETDPINCPNWFGWAAAGDPAGDPWFEPLEVDCPVPDEATVEFMRMQPVIQLACFGRDPIGVLAWWPAQGTGAPPADACLAAAGEVGWLYCSGAHENDIWPNDSEALGAERVYIDPASGLAMPARGQWLRVAGHFDHSAAPECADAESAVAQDPNPDRAILECRTRFVADAMEPAPAP